MYCSWRRRASFFFHALRRDDGIAQGLGQLHGFELASVQFHQFGADALQRVHVALELAFAGWVVVIGKVVLHDGGIQYGAGFRAVLL